ncbi:MAG: hypothetical protein RBT22_12725 [Aliarcobacter sp.]|nr:hypothetical protein [Aliarcobacter sp.]
MLSKEYLLSLKWTYTGWVCCKCREPNQKATCWICGHTRCNDCQDGW